MRKLTRWASLFAIAGMGLLASCGGDEEEEPTPAVDECASKTYPTNTGVAKIEILNLSSDVVTVEAGNILAMAVQITRGTDGPRAKKIRLFQSDCVNALGSEIDLSDQPKGGSNGIDLRRTDDAQLRNVNYTIPAGFTVLYLTVQVDEGGSTTSYKQLTLNVNGSGLISEWTNVELGAGSNSNAARMNSSTGISYKSCNAAENIKYIDITYKVNGTDPYPSYICSNPARFMTPVGASDDASTASCGEDGDLSTAGGDASYFAVSSADFAAADDAVLEALTISTSSNQYAEVTAEGNVFEFMNKDGKKGLIKVTSVNSEFGLNDRRGSITVSVKVQQ